MTTDFVLDKSMFTREMRNISGTETSIATYLFSMRGPEYRRDDANGGAVRWYVYDGLGSVVEEVDPYGNITASRKYDVYGSVRYSTGNSTSKHRFVGQLGHSSDDETGLIYMRSRYMDPLIGRFISEDVSQHGINWYIYAYDNPINFVDADGHIGYFLAQWIADLLEMLGGLGDLTAWDIAQEWSGIYAKDFLLQLLLRLAQKFGVNLAGAFSSEIASISEKTKGDYYGASILDAIAGNKGITAARAEVAVLFAIQIIQWTEAFGWDDYTPGQ